MIEKHTKHLLQVYGIFPTLHTVATLFVIVCTIFKIATLFLPIENWIFVSSTHSKYYLTCIRL